MPAFAVYLRAQHLLRKSDEYLSYCKGSWSRLTGGVCATIEDGPACCQDFAGRSVPHLGRPAFLFPRPLPDELLRLDLEVGVDPPARRGPGHHLSAHV